MLESVRMNRTPPLEVRQELRREVGFGCPVDGCGNPYLYWHHFDPSWSERQHHEPKGMIALCSEHHAKADAGAYTTEQLRALKGNTPREPAGRFDWMRRELLVVVGGNFYHETPIAVQFRGQPVVWVNRDSEGYLLVNLAMLSTSHEPRAMMQDNFWTALGAPSDVECPPSGRKLKIQYSNEDRLGVEFFPVDAIADIVARYPDANADHWGISYPITAVEVQMRVGGTAIDFGPRSTQVGGVQMINCFTSHCGVGLAFS
jgi:hypothetical protein